jgi:hypothetical protein
MSCGSGTKNSKPKPKPELRPGAASQAAQRAELEVLRQKTADLIRQSPEKAAVILASWIHGIPGAQRRKKSG